uniref:Reverse transcriptase domain-containing protein n=1 Tax=Ananas comosus var. bracteatus TaxID=296719 RepID=A0A6V7PF43_ANACO|nr:unnamed protein product [Ananas comosus var. bracteatus]
MVNVMPTSFFKKLGKDEDELKPTDSIMIDFTGNGQQAQGVLTTELTVGSKTLKTAFFVVDADSHYNLLLGRDWIHSNECVPSTFHGKLFQWIGDKVEEIWAEGRPQMIDVNMEDIGHTNWADADPDQISFDEQINKIGYEDDSAAIADVLAPDNSANKAEEVIKDSFHKAEEEGQMNRQTVEMKLEELPIKVGEKKLETQDLLIEVNLGSYEDNKPTFISSKLSAQQQEELKKLLKEYKDCFAWSYEEMPGLSREIVEHRLPIKKGFKPFKQPARRFEPSIVLQIKNEIENLLKAGFIRAARYID